MTRVHLRPDLARKDPGHARTWPARTWPTNCTARKAGAPDPRRLVPGGVHHCRCPSGLAVILWRRAHADCRPLGATARFNSVVAAGKPAVSRRARSIHLSGGRGGIQHQRKQHHRKQHQRKQHRRKQQPWLRPAPQDAAPAAPAALPDQTQLLQTMARGLANLERNIDQLKANQQQMASDNSKAIEELKASQEEIKRVLAKVTEQSLPRRHSLRRRQLRPCAGPSGRRRKRERGLDTPREWMYDDW